MPTSNGKPGRASLIGLLLAGMAAAGAAAPSAALAADGLFLKLDGIEGEATTDGHQKEIVLLSYSQSFTHPPGTRGLGSGAAALANCGAVVVTKLVDKSSPALIGRVLSGRVIPAAVITFRKAGGDLLDYYKVMLTNVLLEAITQTDASPTDPTTILEQVSMSAEQFRFEYTPQNADGSAGGAVTFAWNCKESRQQ